jgi:hypothetical protein
MTRIRLLAAPPALALLAGLPMASAMASPDTGRDARRAEQARALTEAKVDALGAINAVRSAGYTAISEVQWERGRWEVKATDAEGRRATLRVDATSGAVAPRTR